MKHTTRILLAAGFLASSLLGGVMATLLNPDRVQAAPQAAFGPPVKVTAMSVPWVKADVVTSNMTKLGVNLGSFTVQNTDSLVEITIQSDLFVNEITVTGSQVVYIMRVDDTISPIPYTGTSLVRYLQRGTFVPATFSGYWENLPAGQHTISIWAAVFGGTTAGIVSMNINAIPSAGLIIKEYLPFGTTYLPTIQS